MVKKGSKMRGNTSGGMPQPLSRTDGRRYSPTASWGFCATTSGLEPHALLVDLEPSDAAAHGVDGTGAEVHQHLMDLRRVGFDAGRVGIAPMDDLHGRRRGGAQEAERFLDDRRDRDHLARDVGVPAEAEDLTHQQTRALGRLQHFAVRGRGRMIARQIEPAIVR
jgi:hypothetical protein